MHLTYRATAYRQATDPGSPWLLSFVATAEEILTWAGIPRRADTGLIGFQRTEDPARVAKAKEYFRWPQNQSPTALILGLHQPEGTEHFRVTLEGEDEDASVRHCTVEILLDVGDLDPADIADIVRTQASSRIGVADLPPDEAIVEEEADTGESESPEAEEDFDEAEADDDEEIELGTSILSTLLQRLEDPTWVEANLDDLRDLAKPATVIDGQHRILGAARCERDIPFSVVALLDCSWAEQVFQFTVVNYTAKGIPDQFITANAALSLTASELDELQDRLTQAGVKVVEYELMRVVNFDARSPFFNLVNLTTKPNDHLIGYKTMVRIAKAWYSARDSLFGTMLPNLYPDLPGKAAARKRERLLRWRSDDWGEFFIVFWNTVYDRYKEEPSHEPGYSLWEVGHSQLLVAVVLQQLQAAFFSNLRLQDEDFWEVASEDPDEARTQMISKVARRAEKFLNSIPAGFFATKWEMTGLSIGPGRIALDYAFTQLVDSKGRYQYGKSTLVTGKAD